MTFVCSDVNGCPTVTITLIEKSLGNFRLLLAKEVIASLEVALLRVYPDIL